MSPRQARWRSIGLTTIVVMSACPSDPVLVGEDSGTSTNTETTADQPTTGADEMGTPASVTYWQDIAPILYDNCGACHRDQGIGTFSILTYDEARQWAPAIADAVRSRTMPPWLITDDGSCGDFANSQWMEDQEIELIEEWVAEGSAQGEPRDDLMLPNPPGLDDGLELRTPSFIPEIQGGQLAEFDEYRCFLVNPALGGAQFLTGYEVIPGYDPIVHHVIGMPVDLEREVAPGQTNLDVIQALSDQSPDREGWPCFGAAGEGVDIDQIPITWAPGMGVVDFPARTGVEITATDQLVFQVHYNLANSENIGQADQTIIRLRLEDTVEREGFFALPDPFLDSLEDPQPASLEPGQESVTYSWEIPMGPLLNALELPSIDLYGVFPHMHQFGQTIQMQVRNGSEQTCLADVNRWDFNWQLYYFYQQPYPITANDILEVTCNYDTTNVDQPVLPGWGTRNEMCLMGVYLVP